MPARKISDRQIDQVCTLRETGLTYREIAARTGVSIASVTWQCLRLGIDPDTGPRERQAPAPRTYHRHGRPVRMFTQDEDQQLLALEAQGLRIIDIARRMQRRPNSIRNRLSTLARHDARSEG